MPVPTHAVKPPTDCTLRKYGLTAADWLAMAKLQRWTCPVCQQPFGDRKLVVDHEHVAGFKAGKKRKSRDKRGRSKTGIVRVRAMCPADRKPYVRGILHAWCNGFVRRWLTLSRAASILAYLQAHEERKNCRLHPASQ